MACVLQVPLNHLARNPVVNFLNVLQTLIIRGRLVSEAMKQYQVIII